MVGLCLAAQKDNLDMMATLRDGGVVDTGKALYDAANQGREASVKFLLRQDWGIPKRVYVNARNDLGFTPLWLAVGSASPRIARWLLDAGAEETTTCQNTSPLAFGGSRVSPLGFAIDNIRMRHHRCRYATDEQVERMKAVRRVLLRVDAVRALSWLWCSGASCNVRSADEVGSDAERSTTAPNATIVRDQRRTAITALFR